MSEKTPAVSARRCPNGCGALKPFTFRGVALDRCESCAGLWFDACEYQTLDKLDDGVLYALDLDVTPQGVLSLARGARRCPACQTLMLPFSVSARAQVTLDRCELCEGIWADDAELAVLAEALGETPASLEIQTLAPTVRQAMALSDMAALSARQTAHANLLQSLCAALGRRPGLGRG